MAVSGDTVVVGARGGQQRQRASTATRTTTAPAAGAAYVFVRNGNTWSQQAYLKASNTGTEDSSWSVASVGRHGGGAAAGGEDSNANGVNGNQNDNSA